MAVFRFLLGFSFSFFGLSDAVEVGVVDIVVVVFRSRSVEHAVTLGFLLLFDLIFDGGPLERLAGLLGDVFVHLSKVNLEDLVKADVAIAEKVHVVRLFIEVVRQRNDHTLGGGSLEIDPLKHNNLRVGGVSN